MKNEKEKWGRELINEISKYHKKYYPNISLQEVFGKMLEDVVAYELGCNETSGKKHGADAVYEGHPVEIKNATFTKDPLKTTTATFNDTSEEKSKKLGRSIIAVALWGTTYEQGTPKYIVFGKDERIGKELSEKVNKSKSKRPGTVSISVKRLVNEYDFKILVLGDDGGEEPFKWRENIIHKKDFKGISQALGISPYINVLENAIRGHAVSNMNKKPKAKMKIKVQMRNS